MAGMSNKSRPIAIIGAGAFGLSTSLHLSRAGYKNITVFERDPSIPSRFSAANDLNKIVRAEYEDPFYTELALEAIREWKTPLFGPYYHETGYMIATSGAAPQKAKDTLQKSLASIDQLPAFAKRIHRLNCSDDFRKFAWQFSGPMTGFTGYLNYFAGYAHSADTLRAISVECASRGVKFIRGERMGRVVELVKEHESSRCVGVRTADGVLHRVDKTLVASGAHGATLVPDLGKFVTARSWSVAHVQLTKEETSLLRGIPVLNVRDLGFLFEPDPATQLLKLCPLGGGYTNTLSDGTSVAPEDSALNQFIAPEDDRKLRRLLQEVFPMLADRPFVDQKMCWFADTLDSEYCIDFVPGTESSVVVLSGDSGHGFKMMPIFGKWVVELLERGRQDRSGWSWRDTDQRGNTWGGKISWRIGEGGEFADLLRDRKSETLRARL